MTTPKQPEREPISRLKRKRIHCMMWAMLWQDSPTLSWLCLLEWARFGGKPDEVPQ